MFIIHQNLSPKITSVKVGANQAMFNRLSAKFGHEAERAPDDHEVWKAKNKETMRLLRIRRDEEMYALWVTGSTVGVIAKEHNITPEHCRKVLKASFGAKFADWRRKDAVGT